MEKNSQRARLLRELATKIRLRRFELNLSQEKLAELSSCNINSIALIEKGNRNPSYTMIIRIARALLLSPKELMPE